MSQGFAQPQPRPTSKPSPTARVSEVSQHLQNYFSEIEDPRVERSRVHGLMDILMISLLAVIAGAKGWEDIETYGLSQQAWLEQFLS